MFLRVVNAFCFWLLTALGCVLFFIAVIKPPVDEFHRHQDIETQMQAAVAQLETTVQRNAYRIQQLDPKDPNPLLIDRLAREILNFQVGHGQSVPIRPIQPVQLPEGPSPSDEPAGDDAASPVASELDALRQLEAPREALRKLDNPKVQRLQLLMAGVAVAMAIIFFGTPTKRPTAPRQ